MALSEDKYVTWKELLALLGGTIVVILASGAGVVSRAETAVEAGVAQSVAKVAVVKTAFEEHVKDSAVIHREAIVERREQRADILAVYKAIITKGEKQSRLEQLSTELEVADPELSFPPAPPPR